MVPAKAHNPEMKEKLKKLILNCLDIASKFAVDNLSEGQQDASAAIEIIEKDLKNHDQSDITPILERLKDNLQSIVSAEDIKISRIGLKKLTSDFQKLISKLGNPLDTPIYRMHCPMAFGNNGADWFQLDKKLANPYYGAMMLRCGTTEEIIKPSPKAGN